MTQVFRPRESFITVDPQGVKRYFGPETPVVEGHWVLKGREHLFETAEEHATRIGEATGFVSVLPDDVESATAAPGERRSVRRKGAGV